MADDSTHWSRARWTGLARCRSTAFTPTEGEVERARELLAAAEKGAATRQGAVALADGRFVDAAVMRQARRVIALGD